MNDQSTILVYGNDVALLESRAKVLERTGMIVLRLSQKTALEGALLSEPMALLVLCHTLAADEHERALQLATSIRPAMKRLLMTTPKTDKPRQQADLISSSAGPQALVELVNSLLA